MQRRREMRWVKRFATAAFYWLGGIWFVRLLSRVLTPPAIRILYAHHVREDESCDSEAADLLVVSRFEERVRHLARWYHVISMPDAASQLATGTISRRNQVVITFDDGYADNLEACRILRECGVPATIYLTTGLPDSGKPLWFAAVSRAFERAVRSEITLPWENAASPLTTKYEHDIASGRAIAALKKMPAEERARHIGELLSALDLDTTPVMDPEDRMLSWSEVKQLAADPLFTLGAHTVTHQVLSAASAEDAAEEIERSTADLLRLGGVRAVTFAYPNGKRGDYLPHHRCLLRGFGYLSACTTEPGVNCVGADLFALRREPLYGAEPLYTFALRMAGINEVLSRLRCVFSAARRPRAMGRSRQTGRAALNDHIP